MTDTPRKRPQSDAQRQSPTTSLAHRTRAPPSPQHQHQHQHQHEHQHEHARRQTSPSAGGPRDASGPAVSANAGVIHGAKSRAADDDDDDYTSSSGSDSDSDDSDGADEANNSADDENAPRDAGGDGDGDGDGNAASRMPHISGRAKPRIHRLEGDPGLMARLSAFLPQMKTANEDLQREIDAGRGMDLRLDEVDEQSEGRYIEMNLGLGVLEEQHSDDEDKGEKSETPNKKDSESRSKSETDSNVMDTLMGNDESPSSKKPTIQEL